LAAGERATSPSRSSDAITSFIDCGVT
jgi:hypothetical protein